MRAGSVQLRLSQGRAGQGRSLLARHSTGSVRGVQGRGAGMDRRVTGSRLVMTLTGLGRGQLCLR